MKLCKGSHAGVLFADAQAAQASRGAKLVTVLRNLSRGTGDEWHYEIWKYCQSTSKVHA